MWSRRHYHERKRTTLFHYETIKLLLSLRLSLLLVRRGERGGGVIGGEKALEGGRRERERDSGREIDR